MSNNPNRVVNSYEELVGVRERAMLESKWGSKLNIVGKHDPSYKADRGKRLMLARAMENVDRELNRVLRMNEATQAYDIGPFRRHVFNMISTLYPTSIADELVSVQVLSQKLGQIFFLRYLYGSDKGNIKAGDNMLSPFTGAAGYNNYDSEQVDDELIGVAGATEYEGFFQWIPIRKGSVTISSGEDVITDDGNGTLKKASSSVGTINYETGQFEIELSTAATEDLAANYSYNLEYAPAMSGQVTVKVDEAIITARPHKLSALWAFDASYDLEMSQGISIDDAVLEACTAEIRHQRDGNIISALFRQAGNTSTWNQYIPTALTQKEHYESFITELGRACTRITQDTKRATGNWVVVGKTGMDVLFAVGAPRFEGTGDIMGPGPQFIGTLDKRLKVYFNPFMGENDYLVGYKGSSFIDAGYVLGDYLPIFATQLIMLEDFVGRRGFASSYGTKMINNRMYVRGTITNTSS